MNVGQRRSWNDDNINNSNIDRYNYKDESTIV